MEAYYGETFPYETFRQESSVLFHERIKRESLPVKKGVRELLEYLKEQNIPVGLASSTRLSVVTQELQQAGLYEYFCAVTGGDQLKHSKPEPDIYLMACEKMGVRPEETYAVEDSYNGIFVPGRNDADHGAGSAGAHRRNEGEECHHPGRSGEGQGMAYLSVEIAYL